MKAETEFREAPGLLQAFAPDYKKEHFHISGRNIDSESAFWSVIQDDNYDMHKLIKKSLKGAALGYLTSCWYHYLVKAGRNELFTMREFYTSSGWKSTWLRTRGHTMYGAAFGAAWFIIYDKIFCPHGQATHSRFLTAHAVAGALLTSTFYHPASFLYGALFGMLFGGFRVQNEWNTYPEGFRVELPMVSEEVRHQAKIDDTEEVLSLSPAFNLKRDFTLL